uniref:immunoglobulin superfamily member 2 n=1 Tax=Geotrypetes seraphini TaxID=260995 RepID=UPI00145803A7|nr:immunoglobulin superfamily member 2 [Geotrypetes seraphini]
MAVILRLVTSLLILGLCVSRREVTIEKGPLYRVKGYHTTIWCKVSGYRGPSEQNFHWSVYLPVAPQREIQIVSTQNITFTYFMYEPRVERGEIYVERLKGDSVLFHIASLLEEDTGEYECHTPNTDGRWLGSYGDKMHLLVIPDTLVATMASQTFRKMEGDPLELTCEASTATFQHTHLSLTWYLQSGGNITEILSLTKDFVLKPGALYTKRFSSGDVRLDKTGPTFYKLSISKLQPSDQGHFYCKAMEWIQDPDRTWKDIARKETSRTEVIVTTIGREFAVNIDAGRSVLTIGNPFNITCSLKAQNLPARVFQVAWLLNNSEIARVDPQGVAILINNEYGIRESLGELNVARKSNEDYVLKIYHVGLSDEGIYHCEVSEMERTDMGFTAVQSKQSQNVFLNIKFLDSSLKVSLSSISSQITEGESLTFQCDASETSKALSMNWYHTIGQEPREMIASIERDGSLRLGSNYQQRHPYGNVAVEKMSPRTFTLGIHNTLLTDGGSYTCQVTEWTLEAGGSWRKMNDQFEEMSVRVVPLSLDLKVTLISRTPVVQIGNHFDLTCLVSANYSLDGVPMSVTWQFLPSGIEGDYYQTLVQISHNGTIEWSRKYRHIQTRTMVTKSRLRIHRATRKEMARYKCEVEILRKDLENKWMTGATATSSSLMIEVKPQESSLQVSTENKHLEVSSDDSAAEIKCELLAVPEQDRQLAVTWYMLSPLEPGHTLKILSTSYDNVVTYGGKFTSPELRAKYQSERVSRTLYQLRILQMDLSDHGTYHCTLDEWMWSEEDDWHRLRTKVSGNTTIEFKSSADNLNLNTTELTLVLPENQGHFLLACDIISKSSNSSIFSVSWWKRSADGKDQLIFKTDPNLVFQFKNMNSEDKQLGKRLRFERPSEMNYQLMIQEPKVSDSGTYFCFVEEWLMNLRQDPYKNAEKQSGNITIIIPPAELSVLSQVCSSPLLFNFVLICPLLIFLLMSAALIYVCLRTRCNSKEEIHAKNGDCLKLENTDPVYSAKSRYEDEEMMEDEKMRMRTFNYDLN